MTLPPTTGRRATLPPIGSTVNIVYTTRQVRHYALSENEIDNLSQLNSSAALDFSLASFLLSASIGVYTNSIFYDRLNAEGTLAKSYVAPLV